jgi:hypothetical protein
VETRRKLLLGAGTIVTSTILPIHETANGNEITVPPSSRCRGILHISVGDNEWSPTEEQLNHIADLFSSRIG